MQVNPPRLRSRIVASTLCTTAGARPSEGLVEHHELRCAHKAAADRQHLLLAARERPGRLARTLGEDGKQCHHPLQIAPPSVAGPRQHCPHGEILGDRQGGKQLATFRNLANAAVAADAQPPAPNLVLSH
jgi:hypothetical protein